MVDIKPRDHFLIKLNNWVFKLSEIVQYSYNKRKKPKQTMKDLKENLRNSFLSIQWKETV